MEDKRLDDDRDDYDSEHGYVLGKRGHGPQQGWLRGMAALTGSHLISPDNLKSLAEDRVARKTNSLSDPATPTEKREKDKSWPELIERIMQLESHNLQLRNILQKKNEPSKNKNVRTRKKIDFSKVAMRHVLLKFYYLGWDYQGYVTQEDTVNTIEYFLFEALQKCCLIESREKSNYHRCGRTDKGVSAFSQVISIDLRSKLKEPSEANVNEEFSYCAMLNRLLPDNIKCYAWSHVGADTSARFNCSSRTYKYYFPKGNLNIEAMEEGAKFLIGTHDFRNFCKMDVGNGVTVFQREVTFVKILPSAVTTSEQSGYQMLELVIQGKSFLWHQIRCIMSVLLLIGQEKEVPLIVYDLLNIDKNYSKPQYSLANYLSLNLYATEYENVKTKWNIDDQVLVKTVKLLQSQWTSYAIKATMIRDMTENLLKLSTSKFEIKSQSESLHEGVKSKIYKPLLLRMKCESLENKIDHFVKKRKIEVAETSCTKL